jgi:hypothetical protein
MSIFPPDTSARPSSFSSQPLSVPSVTAVDSFSNPHSKKAVKSVRTTSSNKRRRDALDDGFEAHSATAKSSFMSSDVPTPASASGPSNSKSTNAASMITLAGAVASLGTSINHQTMTSDHHIAEKVQGFINSKKYLSDLEKSLAGEYYSLQTTLASGLMSMPPAVAKLTLRRKVKALVKDIDEDMEDMSVSD